MGMEVRQEAAVALRWRAMWDVSMTRPDGAAERPTTREDLDHYDDRGLVAAFRAGRREAFDVIVCRHRRAVYRVCYRFVGSHEDAADLAQDVFVKAFKGLARFKQDAALATWLYRVAVNTCLNRVARRRPPMEPIEPLQIADERDAGPFAAVVRDEITLKVRGAIRKLPPRQRATLVLRLYQGLSHEEIARALGGTVGAAKTNLFHALSNLKRLMQP
jgi:RNA polymerase sigma-70 factor (ECF subfamily)